uniref:Uncharacterized protein n=1 Tax=Arundo donax TaxID=35708 RepID=A0A0A9FYS2_ARUDO
MSFPSPNITLKDTVSFIQWSDEMSAEPCSSYDTRNSVCYTVTS